MLGRVRRHGGHRGSAGLLLDPDLHLPGDAAERDRPVAMASSMQARGAGGTRRTPRLHGMVLTLALVTAACLGLTPLSSSLASFAAALTPRTAPLSAAQLAAPGGPPTPN